MEKRIDYKWKKMRVKETACPEPNGIKLASRIIEIEDYWHIITGKSWMDSEGNPAALMYAIRFGIDKLPYDDNVVYGKIDGLGHLIHISELEEI